MNNNLRYLLNPFTRIAGWKAFFVGLAIVLATSVIGSISYVFFPDLLSVKLSSRIDLLDNIVLQIISIVTVTVVFYLASLLLAKGTRFQDIIGTTTLAKFPYFFVVLLGFIVDNERIVEMDNLLSSMLVSDLLNILLESPDIILFSLMSLPFLVWVLILLYNAFSTSTGLKGIKSVGIFILLIVIVEIISVILSYLLTLSTLL